MKRILFVGHSPKQGGAEICLDTTLRHLDAAKYHAQAVFPWEGPLAQSARSMGIGVDIVPLAWWMNWPRSRWYYANLLMGLVPNVLRLLGIIRRHQIDLVYTNTISIFESALAARIAGVRHVWHCHEVLRPGNGAPSALPLGLHKYLIQRLSDRIVFESNASKNAFEAGSDALPQSCVIYNSTRFEGASPRRRVQARQKLGIADGEIVCGFIGQFIDRKNPLILIRAAALLNKVPAARFLFVGAGPLRQPMLDEIARWKLEDRCRLLEFQVDICGILEAIDILVLPSREESFGLVLVEAGAFGKPVIATRVEGPSEIVVDGKTGYLVNNDDAAELADKIATLCDDPLLRKTMGDFGRQRVEELFAAASNTRRVEELIDEVLALPACRFATAVQ